jgi:hypothetical protein
MIIALILWTLIGGYWYYQTTSLWAERLLWISIPLGGPGVWVMEWVFRREDV